jgi:hypothetical protein
MAAREGRYGAGGQFETRFSIEVAASLRSSQYGFPLRGKPSSRAGFVLQATPEQA